MNYYKLLDKYNFNTVVRTKGIKLQQEYVHGRGWVDTGILTRYFCDESDYYDLYEPITEAEAYAIINSAAHDTGCAEKKRA